MDYLIILIGETRFALRDAKLRTDIERGKEGVLRSEQRCAEIHRGAEGLGQRRVRTSLSGRRVKRGVSRAGE